MKKQFKLNSDQKQLRADAFSEFQKATSGLLGFRNLDQVKGGYGRVVRDLPDLGPVDYWDYVQGDFGQA